MKTDGRLERVLRGGGFAITAEVSPPDSADPELVRRKGALLKEHVDAANATDHTGATVHMSSWAVSALLAQMGVEPVMQMTCRDRNRLALQGDLLGAAALGVRNVLCLTGDHVSVGDHPEAKAVYDLDSLHLLRLARTLRDEGAYLSGRKLATPPRLFLGAAENPFAAPFEFRPQRLAKKVEAGADFVQTQIVYDVERFVAFMQTVRDLGLHERVFILPSVGPLRSARMARFMRDRVPGVVVPDEVMARIERTPEDRQAAEGINLCVEIIQRLREIPGVAGVHIIAVRWEQVVAEIVERAGLARSSVAVPA
ncbi:MAG: methylenetetrahydrofolate reductase [Anaerolineae bacterium]